MQVGQYSIECEIAIGAMDTLNNLTPLAQQAFVLATQEASRVNHGCIATEHLLLGLVVLNQGVAVDVLRKLGVDLEEVRAQIEQRSPCSVPETKTGETRYSPGTKKVLAIAAEQAKSLHHAFVGTEHPLLGLLLGADGLAATILKCKPISVERATYEILNGP
jgi:ATP-dependent Clp protease ATP-binding subunit ClpC